MPSDITKSRLIGHQVDHILLEPLQDKVVLKHLIRMGVNDIVNVRVFSSLTSTNDYLLEEEYNSNDVVVILAEQQTNGRGRYGHQWLSPAGVNLYFSILWPVSGKQKQYEILSLWLLLAIANTLEGYGLNNIQLKWPNDVCLANKKLAGILLERKSSGTNGNLVIGVGLNAAMSIKKDISLDRAWTDLISIKPNLARSRNEIAAGMIVNLYQVLSRFESSQLKNLSEKWKHYDMLLNQRVSFLMNGEKCEGFAKGVDESGNIKIDLSGKIIFLSSSCVHEIKLI